MLKPYHIETDTKESVHTDWPHFYYSFWQSHVTMLSRLSTETLNSRDPPTLATSEAGTVDVCHSLASYFKVGNLHIGLRCGVLHTRITAFRGRCWLSEFRETQSQHILTWWSLTRLPVILGVPLWEKKACSWNHNHLHVPRLWCWLCQMKSRQGDMSPVSPCCTNLMTPRPSQAQARYISGPPCASLLEDPFRHHHHTQNNLQLIWGGTHKCWLLAHTAVTVSEDSPHPSPAPSWTDTASLSGPFGHLHIAFWHWGRNYGVPAFYVRLSEQHPTLWHSHCPGSATWKMKNKNATLWSMVLDDLPDLCKDSMLERSHAPFQ